jgi:predicted ATP-dependent Lon-type protease
MEATMVVYVVWNGLTSCCDEDSIEVIKSSEEAAQKIVNENNVRFDEERRNKGRSFHSWMEEWEVED